MQLSSKIFGGKKSILKGFSILKPSNFIHIQSVQLYRVFIQIEHDTK